METRPQTGNWLFSLSLQTCLLADYLSGQNASGKHSHCRKRRGIIAALVSETSSFCRGKTGAFQGLVEQWQDGPPTRWAAAKPQVCELQTPYAMDAALKRQNKTKQKKSGRQLIGWSGRESNSGCYSCELVSSSLTGLSQSGPTKANASASPCSTPEPAARSFEP